MSVVAFVIALSGAAAVTDVEVVAIFLPAAVAVVAIVPFAAAVDDVFATVLSCCAASINTSRYKKNTFLPLHRPALSVVVAALSAAAAVTAVAVVAIVLPVAVAAIVPFAAAVVDVFATVLSYCLF